MKSRFQTYLLTVLITWTIGYIYPLIVEQTVGNYTNLPATAKVLNHETVITRGTFPLSRTLFIEVQPLNRPSHTRRLIVHFGHGYDSFDTLTRICHLSWSHVHNIMWKLIARLPLILEYYCSLIAINLALHNNSLLKIIGSC